MPPKNRSSLTLEHQIEVIRKSKKDRLSARKRAEHFVLFFLFLGGLLSNKRNHSVTTVNNGIL